MYIETNRLLLRHSRNGDALMLAKAARDVWCDLQAWMSWAHKGTDTEESMQAFLDATREETFLGFHKESRDFIVSTGMHAVADRPGEYAFGYWVAKGHAGHGYATEAAAAMLTHAFNTLNAERVCIEHYEGNHGSRRIIEKVGFEKTGVLEKAHARCSDGERLDVHQYVMGRERWLHITSG